MIDLQYGVVQLQGRWRLIGPGLRFGSYDSRDEAQQAARRLAAEAVGLPVALHLQDERGELHCERLEGQR